MDGMIRIELIDRSMAIAAQAMLALVPMLAVLAAFLPAELSTLALERFRDVTGVGTAGSDIVNSEVDPATVRAQTGVVGILITVFSATSFARAVQRMYERVWEQSHIGGILGLRRSTLWLIGWLLVIQAVSAVGFVLANVDAFDVIRFLGQALASSALWWWTTRTLLFNRVSWGRLAVGALLTGFSLVLYSWGSGLVMPAYVEQSADAARHPRPDPGRDDLAGGFRRRAGRGLGGRTCPGRGRGRRTSGRARHERRGPTPGLGLRSGALRLRARRSRARAAQRERGHDRDEPVGEQPDADHEDQDTQ